MFILKTCSEKNITILSISKALRELKDSIGEMLCSFYEFYSRVTANCELVLFTPAVGRRENWIFPSLTHCTVFNVSLNT